MEDIVTLTAQMQKRLTKFSSSFCIDSVLCFNTENLPPEIKTSGKKAWVNVSGTELPNLKGVTIRYFGNWVHNPKYGMQFKAISYEIREPSSLEGIKNYLSSSLFKGIGKRTVKQLVDFYGVKTIEKIKECGQEIQDFLGFKTANELKEICEKTNTYSEVYDILGKCGISSNVISKIINHFGEFAKDIIKYNPYKLQEVNVNFTTCDRIALKQGFALNTYERVQGALSHIIKKYEASTGDTYFLESMICKETFAFLNSEIKSSITKEKFDDLYNKIISKHDGVIVREFANGKFISSIILDTAEYETSEKILRLLNNKIDEKYQEKIKKALENYCKHSSVSLSQKQKEAVIKSLMNHVSIITGGPGTGKTTITQAIIAVYEKVFARQITLMAPTGKAARRMSEATKHEASTIHSRLGLYEWMKEEEQQPSESIYQGLIVVDESSMMDQILMNKVMQSIKSSDCTIVFVGDVDQLPSVGAGCVLSSMIKSEIIPTSKLTEIFRQKGDSSIVMNAIRINYGKTDKIEFNNSDFIFAEANSEEEAKSKIISLYEEEINKSGVDNVALLCPLRRTKDGKYICSSDGLNPVLQNVVNPSDNYSISYTMPNGTTFRVGDKVMQWKNNKDSYNGDLGIIRNISFDNDVVFSIDWDNGNSVEVFKDEMSSIELGYSMSIHKSQGSEYKTVIIPMLKDQMGLPLYKRNLIYTAVTRAKEKVIIVGSKEAFNKAVLDNECSQRKSFLANRIIAKQNRSF